MKIETVSLVGSGNIAHWLVYALKKADVDIRQIYSRQLDHAKELAAKAGADAIDNLRDLSPDSDLYIFSVKDDSYETLLSQLPFRLPLAVHTAGSLSIRIFEPYADSYGILYPYQSLNKNMDFANVEVPLSVESNDKMVENELFAFAGRLSSTVQLMGEAQRLSSALKCVSKGRAAAPPGLDTSMGVSTSMKPCASRKRRMQEMIFDRLIKVSFTSGFMIRST